MRYAWTSRTAFNSHEKRKQAVPWVLTEQGVIRPAALIRHRAKAKTHWADIKELGPVVAYCGQWPYGVKPTIDETTAAVFLYLWKHTKEKFPDQENSLSRNIKGPLNLGSMNGINIYIHGAEVTITHHGKSKYFELAEPKSLDKILAIYMRWLKYQEKDNAKKAEKDKLTTAQKKLRSIRRMLLRWVIAVAIVVMIAGISYSLLPAWMAFMIYAVTSYTVGFFTKWLTRGPA